MARPKKAKKPSRMVTCQKCKNKPCTKCKGAGQVKAINARSKGANFENVIAKQLTEWTGTLIRRSPMSGGWNKTGDVTPKDPKEMVRFPFNLEMKKQESWHLEDILKGLTGQLPGWWDQCTSDARKSKKVPVLVFTKNGDATYCMMYLRQAKAIKLMRHIKQCSFKFQNRIIFLWEDFLKVSYKSYIKSCKRMVDDENKGKKRKRK